MAANREVTLRHPEIVELAARCYLAQLEAVAAEARPKGRLGTAVRHLTGLQRASVDAAGELALADVPCIRDDLARLSGWQILAVLDQQVLGCGRDDARLLVMGN